LLGGKFALCREALQMRHETQAQWVLEIHTLHGDQIAGYLGGTLSKTDVVVVHCELVGVIRQGVHTCGTQDTESTDSDDSYSIKGCGIPWKPRGF
jgi:hypothetical protein